MNLAGRLGIQPDERRAQLKDAKQIQAEQKK